MITVKSKKKGKWAHPNLQMGFNVYEGFSITKKITNEEFLKFAEAKTPWTSMDHTVNFLLSKSLCRI